jgi:hypothetical protein
VLCSAGRPANVYGSNKHALFRSDRRVVKADQK